MCKFKFAATYRNKGHKTRLKVHLVLYKDFSDESSQLDQFMNQGLWVDVYCVAPNFHSRNFCNFHNCDWICEKGSYTRIQLCDFVVA